MTSIRTIVCCLVFPAMFLFSPSSYSQQPPRGDMMNLDSLLTPQPQRITKWTLSFNPFGLLEGPCAIGIGVGYRLNDRIELWSETTFLTNGFFQTQGPVTGIRQILQGKYFVDEYQNFFIAAEIRYKSYQYRNTEDFTNPSTSPDH